MKEQPFYSSIFRELRYHGGERRDTRMPHATREHGGPMPALDACRVDYSGGPPILGWATYLVSREMKAAGYELLPSIQTRVADFELESKLDALIRIRTRQAKIDANAERFVDADDWWPGVPQGGIKNRYAR